MTVNVPEWAKPAAWGGLAGAIAITIVGFSAGWVVSGSAAQSMAEKQKEQAVIAALTPICVGQFKSETMQEQATQLAVLKDQSSWKRGDFVEEQGWATMPGSNKPNDEVADACATELMKLANKPA